MSKMCTNKRSQAKAFNLLRLLSQGTYGKLHAVTVCATFAWHNAK